MWAGGSRSSAGRQHVKHISEELSRQSAGQIYSRARCERFLKSKGEGRTRRQLSAGQLAGGTSDRERAPVEHSLPMAGRQAVGGEEAERETCHRRSLSCSEGRDELEGSKVRKGGRLRGKCQVSSTSPATSALFRTRASRTEGRSGWRGGEQGRARQARGGRGRRMLSSATRDFVRTRRRTRTGRGKRKA